MLNPKDNIKDCIMTAVHSRLSLWMPKFIEPKDYQLIGTF